MSTKYAMITDVRIKPASESCKGVFDRKDHALIGISPFNKYFSEMVITKLIQWGLNNFKSFDCFIPDTATIYTLKAIGYPFKKAVTKTRRQINYLTNKIIRSFKNLGISENEAQLRILTLKKLCENARYNETYQNCLKIYNTDQLFKNLCLVSSFDVIMQKVKNFKNYNSEVENSISENGVKYLLAEMPLFMDTPTVLNIESSVFIYHTLPRYILDLYVAQRRNFISELQGFIAVKFLT